MIIPFLLDLEPGIECKYIMEFYRLFDIALKSGGFIIAQEEYYQSTDYFLKNKKNFKNVVDWLQKYDIFIPSDDVVLSQKKYCISDSLIKEIKNKKEKAWGISDLFVYLLKNRDPFLEKFLDEIFTQLISKNEKIEAIITFRKYPSVEYIATKYNIKIIYYDMGAFRESAYFNTVYIDFKGHLSDTEIEERYNKFCIEKKKDSFICLNRKEILALVLQKGYLLNMFDQVPKYEIGVVAQWTYFYNKMAYSYTNNLDTIASVKKNYINSEILLRNCPNDVCKANYDGFFTNIDVSDTSCEFILKCKRIVSDCSNMSFEAMLWNKESFVLGQSQYKFMSKSDLKDKNFKEVPLEFINFVTFGFHMPLEYLNDINYLRWRLSKPSEMEIYKKNLEYFLNKKNLDLATLYFPKKKRETIFLSRFKKLNKILEKPRKNDDENNLIYYKKRIEELEGGIKYHQANDKYLNDKLKENEKILEWDKKRIEELEGGIKYHQENDKYLNDKLNESDEKIKNFLNRINDLQETISIYKTNEEKLIEYNTKKILDYKNQVASLEAMNNDIKLQYKNNIKMLESTFSWRVTKILRSRGVHFVKDNILKLVKNKTNKEK